ncbi:MAG TPA: metal-dependent transcriptional regulator [Patescibacteria group bacterium]|jgi:DtxR family Mn-dependent transcriptional regulator|nr:metal-dependent transcriptional regulator [Patescibacteria group bacterium]
MKPPGEERVEELCEEIWSLTEAGRNTLQRVTGGSKLADAAGALRELGIRGLAGVESDRVVLTAEGNRMARAIVRRHRLAEVLFTEVLSLDEAVTESTACEMEHILSSQVTDSICTYLGHPPRCPHGKQIPRGDCCEVFRKDLKPLVMPLSDLGVGEQGRIVFITCASQGSLERVASLGVVPGKVVRLLQKKPSVVFEAGCTSIAVDPEIAGEIYVRREPAAV